MHIEVVADQLGFVSADRVVDLCKAILAAQRDHGNREVRPNARMKYLVHTLGIDDFRQLVEGYFGSKIDPWRPLPAWKYEDWMGWHEQGDGKLFLGINIEQGRIRDYSRQAMQEGPAAKVKSGLKAIVEQLGLTMVLTPSQSVIFRDISPEQRPMVEEILRKHSISPVEEVDPLVRLSMACPALPLCGLAVAEAERRMPEWMAEMRRLLVPTFHCSIILLASYYYYYYFCIIIMVSLLLWYHYYYCIIIMMVS